MSLVAVVDYGAGNTRSVTAALTRLGATSSVTSDPRMLLEADHVVLPGVGSALSAMAHLRETGAADALVQRFDTDQPMLGICLGMQLALEHSDEDGGVRTLGLLPGEVHRIKEGRVPRLGWSPVDPWGAIFYFAHSYACETSAATAYADGVTAAVASRRFVGVQFHPEKSGLAGERWLAACLCLA